VIETGSLALMDGECPFPELVDSIETVTLAATLAAECTVARIREPLRLTIVGPPASPQPTQPEVVSLYWQNVTDPSSPHTVYPRDQIGLWCVAHDADGDPLTVTLELKDDSGQCATGINCWTKVQTFPRRGIDIEHEVEGGMNAPDQPIAGTFTCSVEDDHGHRVSRSTCFWKACPDN
jgi:hypothetical protein